ncbi:MAG TPA: phosphoglucosamine mutase, partial [Acidobacteriota bacterium]|nr:phosphoglucosamine mutase [Acidobacteriota bacterium]
MGRLFGTDGLRGVAGEFPLDNATTELLGHVLYLYLTGRGIEPEIIIGRDTRESGPALFDALCRGFSSAGGKIDDAGVLSTPALAYLATTEQKCTISITASHNPYRDNGIKIFGPDGYKLNEGAENEIEPYLLGVKSYLRDAEPTGCARNVHLQQHFHDRYCQHLVKELFAGLDLRGLRIALDCANGALSHIAPQVLRELGAEVSALHVEPNGRNINEHSGALHPEAILQH